MSPNEIFNLLFDEDVIQYLVDMTITYARNVKGKNLFVTNPSEMRLFLAMLLLTGYAILPHRCMYWENSSDTFNEAMSDRMTRNRFDELLSVIHLCDNSKLNPADPMTKIRAFYAMMNERCLAFFSNNEPQSADEAMLPYYGRHSSKQRIVGKQSAWDTKCGYWLPVTGTLCSLSLTLVQSRLEAREVRLKSGG